MVGCALFDTLEKSKEAIQRVRALDYDPDDDEAAIKWNDEPCGGAWARCLTGGDTFTDIIIRRMEIIERDFTIHPLNAKAACVLRSFPEDEASDVLDDAIKWVTGRTMQ
jgi:hypothetical protein